MKPFRWSLQHGSTTEDGEVVCEVGCCVSEEIKRLLQQSRRLGARAETKAMRLEDRRRSAGVGCSNRQRQMLTAALERERERER